MSEQQTIECAMCGQQPNPDHPVERWRFFAFSNDRTHLVAKGGLTPMCDCCLDGIRLHGMRWEEIDQFERDYFGKVSDNG